MRKWWPLVAVCLGSFMLIVDTTVVTVAVPDMAQGLHAPLSSLLWVLNIYTLSLGVFTLGAGSVADLFGRRRVNLTALTVFALSSLVCGLAPNAAVLIVARGVQGIGGAAMIVTSMALLGGTYDGKDRGTAFGVWGSVLGAAAAVGPLLGGLLTQYLNWRAIFFINLPVSVLAFTLTAAFVKESERPGGSRVDLPGMLAFGVCSGALTYALIRAADGGWTSTPTLELFALSAVALVAFLVIEHRSEHPLLDLALFRNASFVTVMFSVTASAVVFACLVYTSVWLQSVIGLGPLAAGLTLIPLAMTSFVGSTYTGRRLLHKLSPRVTISTGLLLTGVGCALEWLLVDANSDWLTLLPGLVIIGAGVGIGGPAVNSAVMAAVPPARGGMASGSMATFRQLGQTLGVAVLGLVFQAGMAKKLRGQVPNPHSTAVAISNGRVADVSGLHAAGANGLGLVFLASAVLSLLAFLLAVRFISKPAPAPAVGREPASAGAH
ncbi:MFS transporter [Kitasatospora sp. NPDC001119]